ncbi:HlyD family secretion protein [Pusillimonas sp. MFBS29]|uniref:HlyD family secretion protein n=1 Tax=Pusillimonas sp. MFBS29 TaxID=2886690 RepID=UPI001D1268FE|nr:HlyD family secretion protein [Pusillimonas sp. MFBS29]MCC2597775.1 HlyD family secretion protein [Pusillimonas sp. MFBS29]
MKAKIIVALLSPVVVISSVLCLNRHESRASTQSTNDAYVQADFTMVASQVSGVVEDVLIEDNQHVKKGQMLATIDDRDFVVAVNAAKAQVSSAQATIAGLKARLMQQGSTIRQAQAAVAASEAALKLAKTNHKRYRNLAKDGSGTVQALQQSEAQLNIQQAAREKSQAGLESARQQVDILKADLAKVEAALAQARSAEAASELKLSYTRIVAPISGTVGKKSVRIGSFIHAGKPLLAIVPLDAVYIRANFRETQLARVQEGQTVDIEVDALPGDELKGTVDSLGPASGASYSLLAPHNATGNFTKIVQRLPVRIRIDPGQPSAAKLRVGMSTTPTIRIE